MKIHIKGNIVLKSNITLIALCNEFKNDIANKLADRLDMFFVNINDLIKYDLSNIKISERRKMALAYLLKLFFKRIMMR